MPVNSEVLYKWTAVKQKSFCNRISLHAFDCSRVLESAVVELLRVLIVEFHFSSANDGVQAIRCSIGVFWAVTIIFLCV